MSSAHPINFKRRCTSPSHGGKVVGWRRACENGETGRTPSQADTPYLAATAMASLVCVVGIETVTVVPWELNVILNAP
jgi:hypothetical protein